MVLKVMDNYRERLHQCINIQGRHLSDVSFKARCCKTAFCVLSRNRNTFAISSSVLNLFASQIGKESDGKLEQLAQEQQTSRNK